MLTIERSLNIYAAGIPQIISLSQYDDDFQLVFTLYTSEGEFTIPSGTTAEVMGTKVDGNGYSASASISGSTVTVTGNKQMTACAGRNVYEIVLTKSGKRLATVNFILKVERAALDADTIQSETVLKELNAIIDSAETSTQAAAEAAASAAAAAESARTLTIDPTLTQSGQAADAKAVGDEISDLKEDLNRVFSTDAKQALLACLENVEWINSQGEIYLKALKRSLNTDILPVEYEEVEYLESTGTQYIQTNVMSQIPLEMHAKFMPTAINEAPSIGAIDRSDTNNSRFFLLGITTGSEQVSGGYCASRFSASTCYDETYGYDVYWCVTHNQVSYSEPTNIISGVRYSGTSGKVTAYISDGTGSNEADFDIPHPLGNPILLFIKPTSMNGVSMRLYSVQMYVGTERLFDGIPCVRKADNKPGIYDTISKVFYTNAGTGEFVVG